MVTLWAAGYIRRRLKRKYGILKSKRDIRVCLADIEKKIFPEQPPKHSLIITMYLGRNTYNANSLVPGTRPILISADWAVQLLTDAGSETWDASLFTVGHELAHKDGFLWRFSELHFVRWVHEVYCDFSGAEKMLEGDRERALLALDRKMEMKKEISNRSLSEDFYSHPSWERRREYLENYNFDNTLINRIAGDAECRDEDAIRFVKEYFSGRHILLKEGGAGP